MKKSGASSIGIQGGSSLIVIFGVLCLVVFSVLALSGSLAGGRLESASVDATTAYYEADSKAEEKLAELRETGKDGTYNYSVDISDSQSINVSVKIKGDSYEIISWQTNYTAQWQSDDSLILWDGIS